MSQQQRSLGSANVCQIYRQFSSAFRADALMMIKGFRRRSATCVRGRLFVASTSKTTHRRGEQEKNITKQ